MAISPPRLTIYLYSAHRAVIFAIAQLSCFTFISVTMQKRGLVSMDHPLPVLWSRGRWRDLTQNVVTFVPLWTNEVSQCYRKNVLLQNGLEHSNGTDTSFHRTYF